MAKNFWEALRRWARLTNAITATQTVANTVTETEIVATDPIHKQDVMTGLHLRVRAHGVLQSQAAGSGNDLDFAVRYGTTTIVQVEHNGLGTNAVDVAFRAEFDLRIKTANPLESGNVVGVGYVWVGEATPLEVSANTGAAGVACDLSSLDDFNLTAQWGTAAAANTVSFLAASIEVIEGD